MRASAALDLDAARPGDPGGPLRAGLRETLRDRGVVEGVANVELSYGLLTRVEDRDDARSANFDDATLNYDEGVVSNMVQASGEVRTSSPRAATRASSAPTR